MTLPLLRAALVAALPFTLLSGPAADAAQKPLLEIVKDALAGCYGAVVTVCDPYVSAPFGEGDSVPVCAGSCTYVNVPTTPDQVCAGWTSHTGTATNRCVKLKGDPH